MIQNLLSDITEKVKELDKNIYEHQLPESNQHTDRWRELQDIRIKIEAIQTRLYEIDYALVGLNIIPLNK